VFTRAFHWSLSWARSTKFIPPHSISLRSILILSTHLRLGLPSDLFPSGFLTKALVQFSSPPCVVHVKKYNFKFWRWKIRGLRNVGTQLQKYTAPQFRNQGIWPKGHCRYLYSGGTQFVSRPAY
jgi:hypothetical protein